MAIEPPGKAVVSPAANPVGTRSLDVGQRGHPPSPARVRELSAARFRGNLESLTNLRVPFAPATVNAVGLDAGDAAELVEEFVFQRERHRLREEDVGEVRMRS